MNFLRKTAGLLGLKPRFVERWDAGRLAEEKAYLEAFESRPTEMTKSDNRKLIEYLIQRYYPLDRHLPQQKLDRSLRNADLAFDRFGYRTRDLEAERRQVDRLNAAKAARDEVAQQSYRMRPADFYGVIHPILSASDLLRPEVLDEVWSCAFDKDYRYPTSPAGTATKVLCKLYESYRCYQNASYPKLHFSAYDCQCLAAFHRRYIDIGEIHDSFVSAGQHGIVQSIVSSPCIRHETPAMCKTCTSPSEADPLPENPEFEAWLERTARKRRLPQ